MIIRCRLSVNSLLSPPRICRCTVWMSVIHGIQYIACHRHPVGPPVDLCVFLCVQVEIPSSAQSLSVRSSVHPLRICLVSPKRGKGSNETSRPHEDGLVVSLFSIASPILFLLKRKRFFISAYPPLPGQGCRISSMISHAENHICVRSQMLMSVSESVGT